MKSCWAESAVTFLLFICSALQPDTAAAQQSAESGETKCVPGCQCSTRATGDSSREPYLVINCSGLRLKEVPLFTVIPNLPPTIELDLSFNNITVVRRSDFQLPPLVTNNFTVKIRSIDLRNNRISKVEDGTFSTQNIRQLEYLYLSQNLIQEFEDQTFSGHPFQMLDLSHNRLQSFPYAIKRARPQKVKLNNNPIGNLPDDAFAEVGDYRSGSIQELDLSALGMTTFNSCALKINETLQALNTLYMDENEFVNVTRSFFPCMSKSLVRLSMKRCQTHMYERDAFASDQFRFNTLQHLYLSGNNLGVLRRRGFRYLDDLIELDLSECKITNILRNAFLGTSVSELLDLSHNNITEIHDLDFFDMTKVQHIDLSHSNIQRIAGRPFENMTRLQTLDLSYNNLTVIEGSSFFNMSSLQRLVLSHSNVKDLGRRSFKSLTRLTYLDLTCNDIAEIQSQAFFNLRLLKDLRLTECNIQTLANMSFDTLSSLETLDLSYNNISEIEDETFHGLVNVTTLTLTHSLVRKLKGRPFEKMPKLELLLLAENYLTVESFVEALQGTRLIHTLDLSHNMLTKVPNLKRVDFPDLTNLRLGYNNIAVISRADLEGMGFIRELILKENGVEEIEHNAFAECPNITLLDLDGSRLSVLPNLTYLSRLRNLHLNRGRLTELPTDLCQGSSHLVILEVEHNLLTEIPPLGKCRPGITTADFSNNRIHVFQRDTFARQGILRHLELQNNLITVLPDGLFDDTKELEFLNISRNRLTELSPQLFENLVSLVTLDISHNRIQRLERGLFKNNSGMDILYLNDNEISEIDDHAFPDYSQLRRLDLSSNFFTSWRLPSTGFAYLAHLALQGLEGLLHVPTKSETPRIREIQYTHPYHCCIWREYAVDIEYHDDDTLNSTHLPPTVRPPDADPTPPPGWESCPPDHQRTREKLDRLRTVWNITVIVLPDCKIEIVLPPIDSGGEAVEVGTDDEEEFRPLVDDFRGTSSKIGQETRVLYTPKVLCTPAPNALNPCDNLMDPMFLRVAIWAIWVIALLGNGTVLFVAIGALEKLETYQFIICNLAIADFLMGVYLAFLAIVDVRTFGDESFYQSALSWQLGPGCKTAGFIAVFASELSMYMLVLLTVERVYTISYGFNQSEKHKMKFAAGFAIFGWLFALFLAVLPLVGINSYTHVAVCLPYMTTHWYDRAYIGFLISINMIGFLIILCSYCYIFYRIRKSPAQPPTKRGTVATAALKIAVLIVSALICWAPIAVIGYAALAGRSIVTVYQAKFFIVFVYPFNACINPFIYAIFTRHFRHKITSIFKRTKDKVTSFPPGHNLRLHRNAFTDLGCGRVNSPRGNPSPEELRRLRQSRRSNSYSLHYVDPAAKIVQTPSPTARISPPAGVFMGRRSSLPAAFGSTLGPCRTTAMTAETPMYQLPFRLGPLYSSDNSSLPNLQEESDIVKEQPRTETERVTLGGSQDSSLRRLSIVEEEEEVDETELTTKEAELECVSVASSDSEEYIEANEQPVDVVIEKSTDLDDVAGALNEESKCSAAKHVVGEASTSGNDGTSCVVSKRNTDSSSLHGVAMDELRESSGEKKESLERPRRGTSKLSTDSACSGYSSSAVDDPLVASFPDEFKAERESSIVTLRPLLPSSEDKDSPGVSRKSSLTCFEDARSQPVLGDSTSIDSGSCHELTMTIKENGSNQSNSNSNDKRTSRKTDMNDIDCSPNPSVDQKSVHCSNSRSHSSKPQSQTGFSNATFDVKLSKNDTPSHSSNSHSTHSLGITKSETEV